MLLEVWAPRYFSQAFLPFLQDCLDDQAGMNHLLAPLQDYRLLGQHHLDRRGRHVDM